MSHWRDAKRQREEEDKHKFIANLLSNVAEAKKKRDVPAAPAPKPARTAAKASRETDVHGERDAASGIPPTNRSQPEPAAALPKALPPVAFYAAAPEHSFVNDFLKRRARISR